MAEHPIIFTGEMVNAILGGRKTQTRRIIKPQPEELKPLGKFGQMIPYKRGKEILDMPGVRLLEPIKCPYGAVGDTLWVRESFAIFDVDADEDIAIGYKADDTYKTVEWFKDKRKEFKKLQLGKWRPSIYLHRWAARIFLEITNIRVERVQDISWRDCKAEGIILIGDELVFNSQEQKHSLLRTKFNRLWDSINAKRGFGWSKNPFVWIVEFKKINS